MLQPAEPVDLPDILIPEFGPPFQALKGDVRHWLANQPGLVGAWISTSVLEGGQPEGEAMMVVLAEGASEGSHCFQSGEAYILCSAMSGEAIELMLESDADLVEVLGEGYRLCGADDEVFELEAHARQIMRGS